MSVLISVNNKRVADDIGSAAQLHSVWEAVSGAAATTTTVQCASETQQQAPATATTLTVRIPVSWSVGAWETALCEWKHMIASWMLQSATAAAADDDDNTSSTTAATTGGGAASCIIMKLSVDLAALSPSRAASSGILMGSTSVSSNSSSADSAAAVAKEVLFGADIRMTASAPVEVRATTVPRLRDTFIGIVCNNFAKYGTPQIDVSEVAPSSSQPQQQRSPANRRSSGGQQQHHHHHHQRIGSAISDVASENGSIYEHHGRTLSQPGVEDIVGGAMLGGDASHNSPTPPLAPTSAGWTHGRMGSGNAQAWAPAPGGGSAPHSRDHSRTFSNNSQNALYQQQQQQQQAAAVYHYQQQMQQYHEHQRMCSSPPSYTEAVTGGVAPQPLTVTVGKTAKQIQREAAMNVKVTVGGLDPSVHARQASQLSANSDTPQRQHSRSRSREENQQPATTTSKAPEGDPQQHMRQASTNSQHSPGGGGGPPGHRKRLSNLALALTSSPTDNSKALTPPLGPAQPGGDAGGAREDGTSPFPQEMNSSLSRLP